jgi:predicted transcriptional regulator
VFEFCWRKRESSTLPDTFHDVVPALHSGLAYWTLERLMLPRGRLWCMAVEATIKVTPDVKQRLDALKKYPRETYNEVIERLTRDALEEAAEELTGEDIRDIEEAIQDIKAGRVYTTEDLKRELGID